MTTILIKGMEMPKNCFCCSMSHLEGERLFCRRLKDEVLRRKVDSDCPLVELPPHGRLIDADKLHKRIKAECNPYGKPTIGKEDGMRVIEIIEACHTVIETEGGE